MTSNIQTLRDQPVHLKVVNSTFIPSPEVQGPQNENVGTVADVTREEVTARLEASEARVATAVEAMRGDNDRLRHKIEGAVDSIKASADAARLEMASFRSEMLRLQAVGLNETKEAVHNLRIWVLAGALTAAVTLLGMLASNYFKAAPSAPPASQSAPTIIQVPAYVQQAPAPGPAPASTAPRR